MEKFTVEFAGIRIGITAKYETMKGISRAYLVDSEYSDFELVVSDDEIEFETAGIKPGELEALAIYRKIAEKLYEYDAMLMHGVALDVKGEGIIFTARSGTGKSTHAVLWKKLFKDDCICVNGDKPIIRFIDGVPCAYGTPYAGKEGWQTNTHTPVKNLAFINRSETNHVEKAEKSKLLQRLIPSCHIPAEPLARLRTFELLGKFIDSVYFWDIFCNMDSDAAVVASSVIMNDDNGINTLNP